MLKLTKMPAIKKSRKPKRYKRGDYVYMPSEKLASGIFTDFPKCRVFRVREDYTFSSGNRTIALNSYSIGVTPKDVRPATKTQILALRREKAEAAKKSKKAYRYRKGQYVHISNDNIINVLPDCPNCRVFVVDKVQKLQDGLVYLWVKSGTFSTPVESKFINPATKKQITEWKREIAEAMKKQKLAKPYRYRKGQYVYLAEEYGIAESRLPYPNCKVFTIASTMLSHEIVYIKSPNKPYVFPAKVKHIRPATHLEITELKRELKKLTDEPEAINIKVSPMEEPSSEPEKPKLSNVQMVAKGLGATVGIPSDKSSTWVAIEDENFSICLCFDGAGQNFERVTVSKKIYEVVNEEMIAEVKNVPDEED